MDKLEIIGGEALLGEVWISGSKNAALPILAASLLCENLATINNVPHLQDVTTTIELLGTLGVDLSINENMGVEINSSTGVDKSIKLLINGATINPVKAPKML